MPQPVASWTTVPVYGTWRNFDGSLRPGTYEVRIAVRVTNAPDDSIFPAGVVSAGALNTTIAGQPSMMVDVPANDDPDNDIQDFLIQVRVLLREAKEELYQLDVSLAANQLNPPGINLRLASLVPAFTPPNVVPTMVKNIPNGVAGLDGTGHIPAALFGEIPLSPELIEEMAAQVFLELDGLDTSYTFTQYQASGSWVVDHSFGRIPAVAVYVAGELVDTDVIATINRVILSFPNPTAGTAVLT